MNSKNVLSSIALLSIMSACSGSSDSSSGAQSYDQLATQGDKLIAKLDNKNSTPESAMPTVGTATYNGVASIDSEAGVVSALRLDANFSDSTIGGEMTNFTDNNNSGAQGSIKITDGNISGNTFDAKLNGSVTAQGEAISVKGVMTGGFLGANAGAVKGTFEGTQSSGNEIDNFDGKFGAEK